MTKNASLKSVFALLVALVLSVPSFAQYTSSEEKAINKSIALYKADKYDKAISSLEKVQNAHPFDSQLWGYRVVFERDRYNAEYNKILTTVIKQASAGKNIKINSTKLTEYKISMLVSCLQATMYSEKQELASSILRNYLVDPEVDTTISESAKDDYNDGDKEYNNENWSGAIRAYKKAIEKDSMYFNATYSIGMAYYKDGEYEKAIPWFQHSARIEPGMSSSYLAIADCYMELKQWEKAKDACINGIIVYPDVAYFVRLETIADKTDKVYNRHWQERLTLPNDVTLTQGALDGGPWQYYRSAKDKISDYCTDEGLIKKSADFTDQKYLESYSWEFMLKKSNADDEKDYKEMDFARRMQKEGYLDCYAFVSCYHVNFHKQYKDFSAHNADRIRTYINTYIIR